VDLRIILNPKKATTNSSNQNNSNGNNKVEEKKTNESDKKAKDSDNDLWSTEQQKALENALKKYPNSIPTNERWTKISQEVTGKTKKQCVDRYKYIVSLIKNKKDEGN